MVFVVTQRVSVRIFDLDGWQSDLRRVLFVVTTCGVAFVALRLKRWIGAWVVAIGLFMNLLPTVAHGGLMPISIEQLQKSGIYEVTEEDLGKPLPRSKDILLRRDEIRFEWLSDRFILTTPFIGNNIYSAGDFVLAAGLCIAIAEAVIRSSRVERGGPGSSSK